MLSYAKAFTVFSSKTDCVSSVQLHNNELNDICPKFQHHVIVFSC